MAEETKEEVAGQAVVEQGLDEEHAEKRFQQQSIAKVCLGMSQTLAQLVAHQRAAAAAEIWASPIYLG